MANASAAELKAAFDAKKPLTVGLEEEVMLLDPATLDLAACAEEVLEQLKGDSRFKPELPASQVEILTEPCDSVDAAVAALAKGRHDLAAAAEGLARPACVGAHPFAAARGALTSSKRYDRVRTEYGEIASRQLVASLQIHVALGNARETLLVYNAMRSYLPEIAALSANAPYYEGKDSGLASVRPKIAESLPRQGVPPAIETWERFAEDLRWGAAAGTVGEPRLWWWELRPHPAFGTLEVRVPDAQTTLDEVRGVASFVHALVAWLAGRCEEPAVCPAAPSWRIEENRWSACRHGLNGRMADLQTGEVEPTRERLRRLLGALEPIAERHGWSSSLARAAALIDRNGAMRQREIAATKGIRELAGWLAERFLTGDGSGTVSPDNRRG